MATKASMPDPVVAASLQFLEELMADYRPRDFAVRFWEGTVWSPPAGQPASFTLDLCHPGAPRSMFGQGSELALGEAYIYGDFDIEGDLVAAFQLPDYLLARGWGALQALRLHKLLSALPPSRHLETARAAHLGGLVHSRQRDQDSVRFHYDLSNDFFHLWLDRNLVYSCAYFAAPDDDLDTAQERKLDYICRKLRLQPGERLLDIGCGWGSLILHAARHYGAEAFGITLSRAQAELATQRIAEAGLADRCRAVVLDYRDLPPAESFDKIASVGMIEHVGEKRLPEYFRRVWERLRPGGVFLNHGIAISATASAKPRPTFVEKYVFPDAELVPVGITLRLAEAAGFEVRDVENLREHYEKTLRLWLRRLEERSGAARRIVGDVTYRIWRLYLAGSARAFQVGRQGVYQALLSKPDGGRSRLPATRQDWYC